MDNKNQNQTPNAIHKRCIQVPMDKHYLSRKTCKEKAKELLEKKDVCDMTELGVAQEIFAHACCFYLMDALKKLKFDSSMIEDIYKRADPVDIEDGGDTPTRVAVYKLIWAMMPLIV